MNNKVSVIVPIYKVEKYLKKCIDSIINQTYSNLEIILVDDGSPDNCGVICDEYAKKDSRIRVFHQKNSGLSAARNIGTKFASGDYVAYIDSDDYVSLDYIEYLMNLIHKYNADMSIILPFKFNESKDCLPKKNREVIKVFNRNNALITMLYQKHFDNAAWGKLYKKEVVDGIDFPVGKLYEDIGTVYKYILKSDVIVYSNQKKYYYLQRNDSIMGRKYKTNDMDYVYQTELMLNDLKKLDDDKVNNAALARFINANFSILMKIGKNKEYISDRKKIIKNIKSNSFEVLLNFKCRIKSKIAIILLYLNLI